MSSVELIDNISRENTRGKKSTEHLYYTLEIIAHGRVNHAPSMPSLKLEVAESRSQEGFYLGV
jgi:hypothetical protein